MHIFLSYLNFLFTSSNQHGVHSPFVYNFITKSLYKNNISIENETQQLIEYRNFLYSNNKTIEVKDFGAGSRIFKSNQRKISAIAKNAGISNKKANLLLKTLHYFKPKQILELGTSLGMSTICLANNSQSNVVSLEGCPETAKVANHAFIKFNFNNINITIGDFNNTLISTLKNQTFDLVYFDGNHQKEPTLNYFNQCLASIHNNSIFIFDDIHWSKEMESAWNIIKNHKKVSVSIDVFYLGIIFFRSEQPKQHFKIRA